MRINKEELMHGFYLGYHKVHLSDDDYSNIGKAFMDKTDDSVEVVEEKLCNMICKQISKAKPPVTVLFSGGIDSTFMLLMARECFEDKDIATVTIGFEEVDYDESNNAKKILRELGMARSVPLQLYYIHLDFMLKAINKDTYQDWFFSSSLIPTFAAYDLASRSGYTIISGDGGDEIMCGYDRYLFSHYCSKVPPLADALKHFAGTIERKNKVKKYWKSGYEGLVSIWDRETIEHLLDMEVGETILEERSWLTPIHELDAKMLLDIGTELFGVEYSKVETAKRMAGVKDTIHPFMNLDVIKYCASLPVNYKYRRFTRKWLLKRIIAKNHDLSLSWKKKGFAVPIGSWLKENCKLGDFESIYFDNKLVEYLWDSHNFGEDHSERLWSLFMFNQLRRKEVLEVV